MSLAELIDMLRLLNIDYHNFQHIKQLNKKNDFLTQPLVIQGQLI